MRKYWVVIAESCKDCDRRGIKLYKDEPTEEEMWEVGHDLGGMFCIGIKKYELRVDDSLIIDSIH